MRPGDPAPDSARARHRIGSLFRESLFHPRFDQLAAYLVRNIGISLADNHRYPSCWHQFMVGGLALSQLLTLYTTPVVYLYLDRLQARLQRSRRAPEAERPPAIAAE